MNSNEIQVHDQPIDIENDTINSEKNIIYDGKNIIDSVVCSKALCIATGNQIQLYNETYTEHLATITLDCTPEHICFSKNENFIIIADSMGRIHFFHLNTKNIVFSQQLIQPNNTIDNQPCFLSLCFNTKNDSDIEELFVILKDYTMIKFSNIDLIKLDESIDKNNLSLAHEIKKNIIIENIDVGQTIDAPHHQSINDIVIYKTKNNKENIIIGGSGKYSLSVWSYSPEEKKTIMIDAIGDILNDVEILKIKVDDEGKYLFALDEFKRLLVFSLEWMILLYEFSNTNIIDFLILPSKPSYESREIIILTEHKLKKLKRYLEIIQIPNWQVLHKIEISHKSWLIKNENYTRQFNEKKKEDKKVSKKIKTDGEDDNEDVEDPSMDSSSNNKDLLNNLYFIEADSDLKNTVNIRLISEIIPTNQFHYLINNKKFDEALKFAEKNNLSKQVVLKAKLSNLLEDINSSTINYNVQEIIEDLNQMMDIDYVLSFCIDLKLTNYEDTLAILTYADQRIKNSNQQQKDNNLVLKIQQYIKRLGTYVIMKKEGSINSGIPFNSKEWQLFKDSDIIEDIKKCFYYGKILLGIVIWRRHLMDSKKDLIYNICDILDNIPIEIPVEEYIKWLKYEVLTILNPDERSYIYIWIEQRARLIENYEKCPHNALQLMKLIDNNKTASNTFETLFSSKYKTFIAPTPMHHVDNIILLAHSNSYSIFQNKNNIEFMEENKLKHQLQDLVYLWDVHNYKISLEKYDQSEPGGIAFDMLDKVVASELLNKTIQEHFIPYVKENKMNVDKLLSDYCFEIMDQTTATVFDTSTEERILTVLKNITDNEYKADALLEFLHRISIPWSNEVNDMILEELITPNKRINELKGQYRLMQFKLMLLDYEIKSYNISKMSLAKGLVKYILSFISRPNAIDDALQVVNIYHHLNSYDAYIIRIINLCKSEKLNEVLYLIHYGRENEESKRNRQNKNYGKFKIESFIEKHIHDCPEKIQELENTLYEIYYGEEDQYSVEDSILISNNIIRWLIENMENIISSTTDRGYQILNKDKDNQPYDDADIKCLVDQEELDEAIHNYRWVIKSILAIGNLLNEIVEENENKIQDNYLSWANMPYNLTNKFIEDFKSRMKMIKQYFKNINILFEEFGVMVSLKSYRDKEFRKKLLIKFTQLNLSSYHSLTIDSITTSSSTTNSTSSSRPTTTSNIHDNNERMEEDPSSVENNSNTIYYHSTLLDNHSSFHEKDAMIIDNDFSTTSSNKSKSIKGKKKQYDFNENRKRTNMEISDLFNDSHSNLYRFSEILCIPRNEFKSIMVIEASHYGDYEVAILQGKELFKRNRNKETAYVLKSLVNTIITNVLNKSISFKNILKNDRFTNQLQYISQKALSICDESEIDEYLMVYKNCELMNFIFSQCDSGYYTILIRNNKENEFENINKNSSSSSSYSLLNKKSEESFILEDTTDDPYYNSVFNFTPISTKKQKQYHTNDEKYLTETFGNSIFSEQYQEHFLILNTQKAMKMCMDFIMSNNLYYDSELTKKNKEADLDPIKSGHALISYLLSNKCVMTSLNVANLLLEYIYRKGTLFAENFIDQVDTNSYSKLIKISLENILYSRQIDEHLLLGYLLCLPMNKAANIFKAAIKSLDNDYYRTIKFASIGALVGRVWNQRNFQVGCLEAGKHAKWFYQFKCLDIPFSQTLFKNSDNNEYQRSLISCFLLKSNLDIFTVLEFARNYHIEDDFVILEYIKLMLIEKNVTEDYKSKIVGVIDEIANKEKLLVMFTDICLPQVSPYDYDKLQFIYEQMDRLIGNEDTIKKHIMVLNILSSYTRSFPPNKDEFQIYLEISIDNNKLDELIKQYPLCKTRLSFFSLIKSPWKILSSELMDEGNLPKLLPLRIPLDIPIDDFFIKIVDVVLKKMSDEMNEHSDEKNYITKYKFSDIKLYLLKCTPSHNIIEKTIYAASKFPTGKERIEGYQLALYIVNKYLEKLNEQPEKNEKSIEECTIAKSNINHWLSITKTEYQMISLGYHDFVQYCTNPTELIIKLYEEKSCDILLGRDSTDLHSVVSEIAERHGLNIEKIRQSLIQKWISKESSYTPEEKKYYLLSMRIWMNDFSLVENRYSESRIQMILLYIFRSGQKKQRIKTLLNPICKSTKLKHCTRIRALSVLFQLASPDELNEYIEYNKLRNYMQTCLYLADFEDLNIHQSSIEFESCNKRSLVKSLLLHHYNEPKVIQIICNICMDYQIYDLEIWENVICQLMNVKRYVYLLDILDYISNIPEILQMESLLSMWNEIIMKCIEIIKIKPKIYQTNIDIIYLKIITLIHGCPFILELDIDGYLNQFKEMVVESNRHLQIEYEENFKDLIRGLYGLGVLPPLPSVQNIFMDILSNLSSQTLVAILDYFYENENNPKPFYKNHDLSYAIKLIKNGIYEIIIKKNEYHILLNTRYIDNLINYSIDNDNIQNILLLSLKNRMYQTSLNIVTSYYQRYEEKLDNLENSNETVISKLFLLKKYINDHSEFEKDKALIDTVFNELEHKS